MRNNYRCLIMFMYFNLFNILLIFSVISLPFYSATITTLRNTFSILFVHVAQEIKLQPPKK